MRSAIRGESNSLGSSLWQFRRQTARGSHRLKQEIDDRNQHAPRYCRRPSAVPRRAAAGGYKRRVVGQDRRGRIVRGPDRAAGAGFRCRPDPARSDDAGNFGLFRPDLSARAISGDPGGHRIGQRRQRHHPQVARLRRQRIHSQAVRGRDAARRDRQGDGGRCLGAAGHRSVRGGRSGDDAAARPAGDADPATGQGADDAVGRPAQQADRL